MVFDDDGVQIFVVLFICLRLDKIVSDYYVCVIRTNSGSLFPFVWYHPSFPYVHQSEYGNGSVSEVSRRLDSDGGVKGPKNTLKGKGRRGKESQ